MAGRFKLLTDEHWSKGHIEAVRSAGWEVLGAVIAVQRHRIRPGRLLRFLEDLAAEEVPFAGVIRFVPPE